MASSLQSEEITVYPEYLAVILIWQFGQSRNDKTVLHLDCKHGLLSIEYSEPSIYNPVNSIFRVNR